jgi:hypothetical protein
MTKETKLRIHNMMAKAALKFGSEVWVLKKRGEQRLEAAWMKFLRHLLGITKLDKEKNQSVRKKTGTQKGNKTVPAKVATICTEDGHRLPKQALWYRPKGRRSLGRDGQTKFTVRIKEQATHLTPFFLT